jgi:hypothetical protein
MDQSIGQNCYGTWQYDLTQSPSTSKPNCYSTPYCYNAPSHDSAFYSPSNSSSNYYSYGLYDSSPSTYSTYDSSLPYYSTNNASYNSYYNTYDYYAHSYDHQSPQVFHDKICSTPVSIDTTNRCKLAQPSLQKPPLDLLSTSRTGHATSQTKMIQRNTIRKVSCSISIK